jgi:GrpB-like predicted nucleotidyltransferase (UPF0157 family)
MLACPMVSIGAPAAGAAVAVAVGGFARDRMKRQDEIRAITVGEPARLDGPVLLAAYDPAWPEVFAREAARIRRSLGDRALLVEHAGSTAVPGLAAKPIIDIVLCVEDSAAEAGYVPALDAEGYVLRIREPEWHEHRMLKGTEPAVNLHVFTVGSLEVERMLLFRDRLRAVPRDRERYAAAKRALSQREWAYVQHYADSKTDVIEEILDRATGSAPAL